MAIGPAGGKSLGQELGRENKEEGSAGKGGGTQMAQGSVQWDTTAQRTGGALVSDLISATFQDHSGCRGVEGQEAGRVEGVRSKGGFLCFLSSLDTAPLHFIVCLG